jgi:ADP-ribose pyrophosphatase
MIEPWQKIGSRPAGDFGIFTIRADKRVSPRTKKWHEFFVLNSVDWVNVIALTADHQLVMIDQFRHGSETIELEIPGGMIDSSDISPEAAAIRELREETGYAGEKPVIIGKVFPNPAIMSNTCFTVLLENCRREHPVAFDHGEDLQTRLVPVDKVRDLVLKGEIRHSLVVAALFYWELLRADTDSFRGRNGF